MTGAHERKRALERASLSISTRLRNRVKRNYEGAVFQFVVTAVIVCNFCVTIAESEQGGLSESGKLVAVDVAFVAFYTLELAMNLYTTRAVEFICNPWSVFDFAVAAASLVELVLTWGLNSGTGINTNTAYEETL